MPDVFISFILLLNTLSISGEDCSVNLVGTLVIDAELKVKKKKCNGTYGYHGNKMKHNASSVYTMYVRTENINALTARQKLRSTKIYKVEHSVEFAHVRI